MSDIESQRCGQRSGQRSVETPSESSGCCSFDWDSDAWGYDSDNCPDIGNKKKATLAMRKFLGKEDSVAMELKEEREQGSRPKVIHKRRTNDDVNKLFDEIFPKCEYVFKTGKKKGEKCGRRKCKTKTHQPEVDIPVTPNFPVEYC